MNQMQLFNIPKGYKINKTKYSENEIHLSIEPCKKTKAVCSGCQSVHTKGYHGTKEIIVRDLPVSGRIVYLHVIKRRYKCKNGIHANQLFAIPRSVPFLLSCFASLEKKYAGRIHAQTIKN